MVITRNTGRKRLLGNSMGGVPQPPTNIRTGYHLVHLVKALLCNYSCAVLVTYQTVLCTLVDKNFTLRNNKLRVCSTFWENKDYQLKLPNAPPLSILNRSTYEYNCNACELHEGAIKHLPVQFTVQITARDHPFLGMFAS